MLVQINTDNEGRDALTGQLTAEFDMALSRFASRITRIEVHLGDTGAADRPGSLDKRRLIEARPTGRQPLAVSHQAATLEEAWRGATRKLRLAL